MLMRFFFVLFFAFFFFFCFFNEADLMTRNSKETIQKHNKRGTTGYQFFSLHARLCTFSVAFLVLKKKKERKIVKKEKRPL